MRFLDKKSSNRLHGVVYKVSKYDAPIGATWSKWKKNCTISQELIDDFDLCFIKFVYFFWEIITHHPSNYYCQTYIFLRLNLQASVYPTNDFTFFDVEIITTINWRIPTFSENGTYKYDCVLLSKMYDIGSTLNLFIVSLR